jgi:cell division protease FtsH
MARTRMREGRSDASTPTDVERGLTEYDEKLNPTPREERLLATHEGGHAIVSLFTEHSRPIERITIRSEVSWAAAYVRYKNDDTRRLGLTFNQMFADLCTLFGGIEAERLLLGDVSTGAAGSDLVHATSLAHYMVECCGMGGDGKKINLRQYRNPETGERYKDLSEEQLAEVDREVSLLIARARERSHEILSQNRALLESLRALLIEKKTIDAKTLKEMFPSIPAIQRCEEVGEAATGKGDGKGDGKAEAPPAKEEKPKGRAKAKAE